MPSASIHTGRAPPGVEPVTPKAKPERHNLTYMEVSPIAKNGQTENSLEMGIDLHTDQRRERADLIFEAMQENGIRRNEEWHNWIQTSLAEKEDTDRKFEKMFEMLCRNNNEIGSPGNSNHCLLHRPECDNAV